LKNAANGAWYFGRFSLKEDAEQAAKLARAEFMPYSQERMEELYV
jgi:hypothetical protein